MRDPYVPPWHRRWLEFLERDVEVRALLGERADETVRAAQGLSWFGAGFFENRALGVVFTAVAYRIATQDRDSVCEDVLDWLAEAPYGEQLDEPAAPPPLPDEVRPFLNDDASRALRTAMDGSLLDDVRQELGRTTTTEAAYDVAVVNIDPDHGDNEMSPQVELYRRHLRGADPHAAARLEQLRDVVERALSACP